MSAELKPCPFCGGDKQMVLPPNCTKTGNYNPGDNAQPIVRCLTCFAEAMGNPWDYTKESAVTAWNRRADLAPTRPSADYVAVSKRGQNLMEVALWTELREAMLKDQWPVPKSLGANATAVIKRTVAEYLEALAARPDQPAADTRVAPNPEALSKNNITIITEAPAPSDKIAEAADTPNLQAAAMRARSGRKLWAACSECEANSCDYFLHPIKDLAQSGEKWLCSECWGEDDGDWAVAVKRHKYFGAVDAADMRNVNSLIDRIRDAETSAMRHALAHELRHTVAALGVPQLASSEMRSRAAEVVINSQITLYNGEPTLTPRKLHSVDAITYATAILALPLEADHADLLREAAKLIIAKWDADTASGLVYGPNEYAVLIRALALETP